VHSGLQLNFLAYGQDLKPPLNPGRGKDQAAARFKSHGEEAVLCLPTISEDSL